MDQVVIVIHLLIVVALVGVVLVQKSEGGGLGMGGGGGGNFMSTRGTANVLTRTTTYLAIAFFITSMTLGVLATQSRTQRGT
jgi:preprotein translocase subunit SecG